MQTVPNCAVFKRGWACYPKNQRQQPFLPQTTKELVEMWRLGNKDKSTKVSAERALDLLFNPKTGPLQHNWTEQLTVSVAKIKAFFSKNPQEIRNLKRSFDRVFETPTPTPTPTPTTATATATDTAALVAMETPSELTSTETTTKHQWRPDDGRDTYGDTNSDTKSDTNGNTNGNSSDGRRDTNFIFESCGEAGCDYLA